MHDNAQERGEIHSMSEGVRTIGSVVESLVPASQWDAMPEWPPDVFALTALLLKETEAFLLVVSPPAGKVWPPTSGWAAMVREVGRDWAARLGPPAEALPHLLVESWHTLEQASEVPLDELSQGGCWDVCLAVLTLHALADEACAGLGTSRRRVAGSFESRAWQRLRETGSLSRLPTGRVKIVPKTHLTLGGINLRSVSRHLAAYTSHVEVTWGQARANGAGRSGEPRSTYSVLLIPWPREVRSADFQRVGGPLLEMDRTGFGFFEFHPHQPLDLAYVEAALQGAARRTPSVDLMLLPEAAVLPAELGQLEELAAKYGVVSLTTGVREPAPSATSLGRSYAHMGLWSEGRWQRVQVDKHHRWGLDANQIRQYHLSGALPPGRLWWEAIQIPRRRLHILDMEGVGPIAVLICEDLARLDAVADVLRFVGPTLVLALLLDGPQLGTRWSSRYASVLADDPGAAVLTLTSLGMAKRSRPAGHRPSRTIALWKDPNRGLHEIEMGRGALAVLLTLGKQASTAWTADGRGHEDGAPRLVLQSATQIYPRRASAAHGAPAEQAPAPR
ncbi:MAG: hypothetical protein A2V75_00400, partial [Actinobacteria bacterium RBG_16_70_17]